MIIREHNYVHLGTFAPAGAGKGIGAVIPNLLAFPGSVCVVDCKRENYLASAVHRQRRFGRRTARLDPFGSGDSLNMLDFLDPRSPLLLDQCRDIANRLIHRKGTETDPHWNDAAELVLSVFIYNIAACETNPARRNLLPVRATVQSPDAYHASRHVMEQHGGILKQQADSLAWLQEKELNSVLSTVQRQTAWMDSPPVAACLRRSTFDPLELRGRLDLYLTIPPERLERLAPLMRLWLGTLLDRLIGDGPDESRQVLFVVDEAAHIGRIQILEDAITLLRGYGIRVWLFFQSINHLQKCYSDNAQTILDNLGHQQYFGISNSFDSMEAVSKKIGDCTITQVSVNKTDGRSRSTGSAGCGGEGNASSSVSVTTSEMARRWAKEEEIRTLPADMALIFAGNMPVITAQLCKYYNAKQFRNGRTGDDSGLGLAAGLMALFLLLASLLLSAAVASLPPPPSRPAASPPQPAVASPPSLPTRQRPNTLPAPRRNRNDRLPSRSGFLIPIR
jgi:type IV secretion system protein VirD4